MPDDHRIAPSPAPGAAESRPAAEADGRRRIRVTSRESLLRLVPVLLGFRPDASVVVLGTQAPGETVKISVHCSLDDLAGRRAAGDCVADVLNVLTGQGVTQAVVIGYGPDARVAPVTGLFQEQAGSRGLRLTDLLRVEGNRYWSHACAGPACCPPEGTPFDPAPGPELTGLLPEGAPACWPAGKRCRIWSRRSPGLTPGRCWRQSVRPKPGPAGLPGGRGHHSARRQGAIRSLGPASGLCGMLSAGTGKEKARLSRTTRLRGCWFPCGMPGSATTPGAGWKPSGGGRTGGSGSTSPGGLSLARWLRRRRCWPLSPGSPATGRSPAWHWNARSPMIRATGWPCSCAGRSVAVRIRRRPGCP
jgi:hypothetical protein